MKHLRTLSFLCAALALILAVLPGNSASAAGLCYVDANASGLNNGSSWTDAYTDLQSALGASPCTEVWVADGTYKPTSGTDRNASFQLKSGVAIYGGFAGTETLLTQRNPAVNIAILSGEIGAADNSDNSYHVVRGANSATLDGFTITGGNANGDPCPVFSTGCGGGIYNSYTNPTLSNLIVSGNAGNRGGGIYNGYCSPTLSNLTIRNNSATDGGGMLNWVSHPSITNITVSLNTASGYGGGMFNYSSYPQINGATFSTNSAGNGGGMFNMGGSGPELRNVTFNGNTAGDGAGMGNDGSSPTLYRVTFQGNTASGFGGGMNNWLNSNPTLTNVTFSGNSAGNAAGNGGGGMNNYSSDPSLMNVTFNNNSASGGGGMFNWQSNPILKNVTFSANTASRSGGGIANWFTDTPQTWANLTFANNSAGTSGGAIFNYYSAHEINIVNAIFWGNTASSGPQINKDSSGNDPIVAYSVIQGGCPMVDVICLYPYDGDPVLGSLGNYGGYTQTIPFYGWSPLDHGQSDIDCPPTDQRGVPRPKGTACDIGAYESLDSLAPETMIDDQNPHLSPTRSTSMAITFSGTDLLYGVNHFECSLDGAGFSTCTSPISYGGLGDGQHTFQVFAVNNQNTPDPTPASYSWTVDATPPSLSLPANITAEATSPAGASVAFTVTATDTVDPSPAIACTPSSGSTFALGVTTVNCTATDDMGNASSGSFTVTVQDTTPPNLNLPANITAEATSPAGAAVTFTVTASDAADSSPTISCAPPSGSTFALDVTATVNCTATDDTGNVSSGSFTIRVVDTTPPNLGLPANIIAEATSPAGAVVNFTVTATDAVDPSPVISCTPPSGSIFPLGVTTVNCTASDQHGNVGSGSFTVSVRDTTPPILSLPANITAEATSAAGAVVNFTVTATDIVDTSVTIVCAPPSGSTFPLGPTTVNCTATDDAGNVASGSFTVTVQDTTAPTLTLPADMTVLPSGPAGAVVNFTVTATDAVDPDPVVSCTPPSGSTFPIATTTVHCTATDDAGNVATGSFTITVGGTRISAVFRSFGAYDGTLRESSEISGISNFADAGNALITVGDDSYKRQYMGILDFDTSTLPEGAAITEVTLQVKVSILSAGIYTALGDLMAEVANPHFGTLPNLQTADFTAPSLADAGLFSRAMAGNNWITLNMDPSSLFAVNTAGRTQFRLRFQVDDSNNLIKHDLRFFSGNYLLATYRPTLTIVYYVLP